jgi:hypothetical protein
MNARSARPTRLRQHVVVLFAVACGDVKDPSSPGQLDSATDPPSIDGASVPAIDGPRADASSMPAFRGMFEFNDAGCGACQNPNLFTNACSCPGGALPISSLRVINDCAGGGTHHGATVQICPVVSSTVGEFRGAYQVDDAVGGGQGCRHRNPLTASCACPPLTARIGVRTLVDTASGLIGSTISLCMVLTVTPEDFGGAYQVDDGGACRSKNPVTAGCSCPSGSLDQVLRLEVDGPKGSRLHVCYPPS